MPITNKRLKAVVTDRWRATPTKSRNKEFGLLNREDKGDLADEGDVVAKKGE